MQFRNYLYILALFTGINSSASAQVDHWETAVFPEDIWAYRLGTSEPPASWIQSDFDDSAWNNGAGGFGYGDDDDNTIIAPTLSLYIRKQFNITDITAIEQVILQAV